MPDRSTARSRGLGEFGLIARGHPGPRPAREHASSGRATTPPWSRRRTGAWWRPPTCSSRACTSGWTGPLPSRWGARPRRPTWPTSPRWARCRRPCSSGWPPRPTHPVETVAGLADGLWAEAAVVGVGPGRRRRRDVGHAHPRGHRARVARGAGTGHPVRGAAGRRGGARGRLGWAAAGLAVLAARLPVARRGGGGAPGAGAAVRGGPGGRGGGRHGHDRRLGRPARRPRAHRGGVRGA